jgi:dTDP-glucose pyrophosphorylase
MARRINLIPMAGAGQRFVEAGFTVPKPLIEIAGLPMIAHAAHSLPVPDLWIFVCRAEHVADAHIDRTLERLFQPCRIITVNHLTEGQACTCLLARDELRPDDVLTIGACDNVMKWDRAAYEQQFLHSNVDFLVWTFRHNPAVLQDPRMYGWVRVDNAGGATSVSVKIPISDTPMSDHAVIGAFTFRRAGLFLEACNDMIRENARIKNEFYVDNAINFALARGARGRPFEVDRYICWGTPRDLEIYNYWRGIFLSENTIHI